MKKLLLATAAVMALTATAAQAEVKLDLGGFFKGYAGYSDQDTADLRKFDFKRKSQLFFMGETTLDNGLTVGYHGEMLADNTEALSTAGGEIGMEQNYIYFSGNWGRVNAGQGNGAAYLLQVAAPGADANLDGMDIDFSFFNAGGANSARQDYKQAGPRSDDAQYSDKIVYMTPKFNGFQGGLSYSPRYSTLQRPTQLGGMEADNTAADLENMMEAAVRYDGEMSGLGVHVGAGYTTAGVESTTGVATSAFGSDDYQEWNVGAKVSYNNFGLGAVYLTDNSAVQDSDNDAKTWTVGADYTWGSYVFGASYFDSVREQGATADDSITRWMVGATYTFGPGMDFRGAVGTTEEEIAGVDGNDATIVTLGTDIQF